MRLNELLNHHRKQHGAKRNDSSRFVWATSNLVLMFLEPSILKFTSEPIFTEQNTEVPEAFKPARETMKPKLIPWQVFKSQLHDILDHRIQHAQEIDGGINNSFMSLDEHLVIFMMQVQLTRPKTEHALIEFLASLKYYAEQWQRAKVYAQMLGFYQSDDSFAPAFYDDGYESDGQLPARMNNGVIDDLEDPYFDIYQQEFYLHCYSLLQKWKSGYQDSKEGYTYIP